MKTMKSELWVALAAAAVAANEANWRRVTVREKFKLCRDELDAAETAHEKALAAYWEASKAFLDATAVRSSPPNSAVP